MLRDLQADRPFADAALLCPALLYSPSVLLQTWNESFDFKSSLQVCMLSGVSVRQGVLGVGRAAKGAKRKRKRAVRQRLRTKHSRKAGSKESLQKQSRGREKQRGWNLTSGGIQRGLGTARGGATPCAPGCRCCSGAPSPPRWAPRAGGRCPPPAPPPPWSSGTPAGAGASVGRRKLVKNPQGPDEPEHSWAHQDLAAKPGMACRTTESMLIPARRLRALLC